MQLMYDDAPARDENVPELHCTHLSAPVELDHIPGSHAKHWVIEMRPEYLLKVPALQGMQTSREVAAREEDQVPMPHDMQGITAPPDQVPSLHSIHDEEDVAAT